LYCRGAASGQGWVRPRQTPDHLAQLA